MTHAFPASTPRFARTARHLVVALLCLGAFAGSAASAQADVSAPDVQQSFSANPMTVGTTTNLIIQVTDLNSSTSLSNIAFSETVPSGVQLLQANSTDCNGTGSFTGDPSTGVITLSGSTLVPGGQCFMSVKVKGTAAGTHTITAGSITATESGATSSTSSATLNVVGPGALSTSFAAPSVVVGATTTASFTVTNPNGVDLTGVAFSDALPAGLKVATPNNLTSTCDPGATLTATAGGTSISLSGATVTASSNCTITADVTATAAGSLTNTTSAITSSNPAQSGPAASASLLVVQAPALTTGFGQPAIKVNTSTTATFSIHNPNASTALTGVAVTDPLPAGLVVASPNGVTGSCGAGTITAVAGSSTISLSGGSLATSATCTFSVSVTATAAGALSNTTNPVTSTQSGPAGTANASLNVFGPPTIATSFADASLAQNTTTTLSLTITNPATNPGDLHGAGVTDTLPAGLVIATPNGLSASCTGATVTAAAGSSSITISGATVVPNGTCHLTVTVLATTVGTLTNTTGTVTSTEGGNGATASASVVVALAPALHIAFSPTSIAAGGTSNLSFNVTNPNSVSLAGVAFTDTLPLGLTIAASGLTGTCGAGTITAQDGTGEVDLSGATLAAHGSCTFTVKVTSTTLGTAADTTSTVTSSNGGAGAASSASLLVLQAPTATLAFGDHTLIAGRSTNVVITIANPNPGTPLTGVAIADALPAGLVVASPSGAWSNCSGTVTATPGAGSLNLSGGSLASSGSCSVLVSVIATTPGLKNDTTGAVTSTQTGPGGTGSDSLTASVPPTIATSFGAAALVSGNTTTLNFAITNPSGNVVDLHGVGFDDALPAGLVVASPSGLTGGCYNGPIQADPGASEVSLSGATLSPGVTCAFSVQVKAVAGGAQVNTTGHVTSTEGGNGPTASATIDVPTPPTIATAFGDATVSLSGLTGISFTLSNPNPVALTGIGFTDPLPDGLVLVTLKPLTSGCGGAITTSAASLTLANGKLAAGATCSFSTYVSGGSLGTKNNLTGAVTSNEGGTGATASASVTVGLAPPPGPPVTAALPVVAPPAVATDPTKAKTTTKTTQTHTVSCVVPHLTGQTLTKGKSMLSKAHCKLGKVTRKHVKAAKVGRITHQSVKAGAKHAAGTKVALTVAR